MKKFITLKMLNIVSSLMLLVVKWNKVDKADGTVRSKSGLYSLQFFKLNEGILDRGEAERS